MIEALSLRAKQIVFAARFKAGERGAKTIDIDDFLVGLLLEDQGVLVKTIFSKIHEGQGNFVNEVPSHIPFFPSKIDEDLVADLENVLPQSLPVALSTEVPLSPSLERVFNSAKSLQTQLQHSAVEPLHLLAAILTEESSQGVKLLQDSGVTKEKVLLKLRAAT